MFVEDRPRLRSANVQDGIRFFPGNASHKIRGATLGEKVTGGPPGSWNKTTIAVETLAKYGEQVAARVVKRAVDGDMIAARLILDR
jgi:hypothetical protein